MKKSKARRAYGRYVDRSVTIICLFEGPMVKVGIKRLLLPLVII